eukprot:CAMPEP_0176425510 /NCGR_PEP_ID=MMETSP0127-20121128/11429_1 /TAXON_ID=938130 /ORGANISM="Platyophrya macrostoma, Strain WH" /LENGTH=508 /DNA_ID=CAMNT_0017806679 /DNA_START=16 /DNA_END=1542 /DNA_ORIENTATION=+
MTKISALLLISLCVQSHLQFALANDSGTATDGASGTNTGGMSYWEKEFQDNAQKFYHHFEVFFADFVVPAYHMVKESALLTAAVLLILILYFTKSFLGLFKGDGTKKFKYNKEEPLNYSDLNQHFRNFTKELDELKQQVKKSPEAGQGAAAETQVASAGAVNVPELEKLTKSLGKTEDHLTKLYQENKQLNQFLASFQREILESHKEIWKELHSLKTARPATSSVRSGERRGQSVSAEDRIPRRLQESAPTKTTQPEVGHRGREPATTTNTTPFDAGAHKTSLSNGTNPEVKQDSSVKSSQEISKLSQEQHTTAADTKKTEKPNPFSDVQGNDEQKAPPMQNANPVSKQPGFQKPNPQVRPPFGGPMKQPPVMTTNTSDTQTQKSAEKQEEVRKSLTSETNPFISPDKIVTQNESNADSTTLSTTEEAKSTTTDQTNPETEPTQMPTFGAPTFGGLPNKKPTPVVRNNFAIPGKRVTPVPGNIKKPPIMNPGANFTANPEGGSGGANI